MFPRGAPDGDGTRLSVSVPLIALFWAAALAFVFIQRPEAYLDPHGLTIRRLRRDLAHRLG